ncbi:UNVERIFIED_CONTAM: hypothetical protein RMT77_011214 [Armadillidium vulgare]
MEIGVEYASSNTGILITQIWSFMIFIEFFFKTCTSVEMVKVFDLQTEAFEPSRNDAYIHWNLQKLLKPEKQVGFEELTVCFRVKLRYFKKDNFFFSYATSDFTTKTLLFARQNDLLLFYYGDVNESSYTEKITTNSSINQWEHYCHVFEHPKYSLYINGKLTGQAQLKRSPKILPMNGSIFVGQKQEKFRGGFDKYQSLSAEMTQINVWSRSLNASEIKAIADCRRNVNGDIITSQSKFEMSKVPHVDVPLESICTRNNNRSFIVFPLLRSYHDATTFCQNNLGLHLFTPVKEEENLELFNISSTFQECFANSLQVTWIGSSDIEEEGVWISQNNKSLVKYTSWSPGEPSGGSDFNCASMEKYNGYWMDAKCLATFCFACQIPQNHIFYLRGLCFFSKPESQFKIYGYKNEQPYFLGFYDLVIYFNTTYWLIWDRDSNTTLAYLDALYPFGRKSWTFEDKFCSYKTPNKLFNLSFSSCLDHQFMCYNGPCIPLGKRCNIFMDCDDGSDEEGCSFIDFPKNYKNQNPPPGNVKNEPLKIQISIDIRKISNIDDISSTFSAEFYVHCQWQDRTLKYRNLRHNKSLNKLNEQTSAIIWKPKISFLNIDEGEWKILDEAVYMEVIGESSPYNFNELEMDENYDNSSVILVQKQLHLGRFSCQFKFFNYPFDSQTCFINIIMLMNPETFLKFENDSIIYTGLSLLPKHEISNFETHLVSIEEYSAVKVL